MEIWCGRKNSELLFTPESCSEPYTEFQSSMRSIPTWILSSRLVWHFAHTGNTHNRRRRVLRRKCRDVFQKGVGLSAAMGQRDTTRGEVVMERRTQDAKGALTKSEYRQEGLRLHKTATVRMTSALQLTELHVRVPWGDCNAENSTPSYSSQVPTRPARVTSQRFVIKFDPSCPSRAVA